MHFNNVTMLQNNETDVEHWGVPQNILYIDYGVHKIYRAFTKIPYTI